MPQGLPTLVPGGLIESAHHNAVADRIVGRFANVAERDAAIPIPTNGMVVWRGDLTGGNLELRRGGAWVPLLRDGTRVGCSLTTTGQSVPTNVPTDLAWVTEVFDTDNFHAGTGAPVVIPAGLAGMYVFSAYVDYGGTLNGPGSIAVAAGASINRIAYVPSGNRNLSVSTHFEAGAGASITVRVTSGHSATVTVSGQFVVSRISV